MYIGVGWKPVVNCMFQIYIVCTDTFRSNVYVCQSSGHSTLEVEVCPYSIQFNEESATFLLNVRLCGVACEHIAELAEYQTRGTLLTTSKQDEQ